MTQVNQNNPCAGKYGNCLDVKITDQCNGKCAFCIEKGGRHGHNLMDVNKLAEIASFKKYDSILILGGEPTLYPSLVTFLMKVKQLTPLSKTKIYLTTNGSQLSLQLAMDISPFLTGINISIHHYLLNQEITGVSLHPEITKAIQFLNKYNIDVRLNCNLIKGYIDSIQEVNKMIQFRDLLGIKSIRFAELQECPELFVDARNIWTSLTADPFTQGCECNFDKDNGIVIRQTCGLVNPLKKIPINPEGRIGKVDVLYNDGYVGSWSNSKCHVSPKQKYSSGCHLSHQPDSKGCH